MARKPRQPTYDVELVRSAAAHRWPEILSSLGGVARELLDGSSQEHPCPKCGGETRFRMIDVAAGALYCNQCFRERNGDGFAALQWLRDVDFPVALELIANYVGVLPSNNKGKPSKTKAVKKRQRYPTLQKAIAAVHAGLVKGGQSPSKTAEGWIYTNATGVERFATVRYDVAIGKTYRPFSKDGDAWLIGDPPSGKIPLFELPSLADPELVYVVEGEKCAEVARAIGMIATTSAHGSKSPHLTDWSPLAGKRVVILPDNDDPGRAYACEVSAILSALTPPATVTVRRLPVQGEGDDIADLVAERRAAGMSDSDIHGEIEGLPDDTSDKGRPRVALPGGETSIVEASSVFGSLLGATKRFFNRGGAPMRLVSASGERARLEPMKPAALCSDIETVAEPAKLVHGEDGPELKSTTCNEGTARLILGADAFRESLPPLKCLSRCPVLVERNGRLVQLSGYDRDSGVLASGETFPAISLNESLPLLDLLVADFRFATPADKSRALAAIITPTLLLGGLLAGRAPADLREADSSQSGKGYGSRIKAAVYNCTPVTISQRAQGGVGSIQESFDAALVAGASFIDFDNFRGRFDLPGVESFLTEDVYLARVPYGSPIPIDPRRVLIQFSSNQANTTNDFANRCSCVRILKQPAGYAYRSFPEGDLLDHVRAHQPRFLAAVFSVVREWHRQGKPELATVDHDFRRWARVLGWIVENILGSAPLLDGHRCAQQRMSSPGLNWVRDLVLAVDRAKHLGQWLRPNRLLEIAVDQGVDTPGVDPNAVLDDGETWLKGSRLVGRKLGHVFKGGESIAIDGFTMTRRVVLDDRFREQKEYCIEPIPDCPDNDPQCRTPNRATPEYSGGQNGRSASRDLFGDDEQTAVNGNGTEFYSGAPNSDPERKHGTPEYPEYSQHPIRDYDSSSHSASAIGVLDPIQAFGASGEFCSRCGGRQFADFQIRDKRVRRDCSRCGMTLEIVAAAAEPLTTGRG